MILFISSCGGPGPQASRRIHKTTVLVHQPTNQADLPLLQRTHVLVLYCTIQYNTTSLSAHLTSSIPHQSPNHRLQLPPPLLPLPHPHPHQSPLFFFSIFILSRPPPRPPPLPQLPHPLLAMEIPPLPRQRPHLPRDRRPGPRHARQQPRVRHPAEPRHGEEPPQRHCCCCCC